MIDQRVSEGIKVNFLTKKLIQQQFLLNLLKNLTLNNSYIYRKNK